MQIEYDAEARCLYVRLRDGEVADSVELDDWRVIDHDAAGAVLGVEFILIDQHPIDLTDLPDAPAIQAALDACHGATARSA